MHRTPDWNMYRSTNIINIHKYTDLSFGKYTSKMGSKITAQNNWKRIID